MNIFNVTTSNCIKSKISLLESQKVDLYEIYSRAFDKGLSICADDIFDSIVNLSTAIQNLKNSLEELKET